MRASLISVLIVVATLASGHGHAQSAASADDAAVLRAVFLAWGGCRSDRTVEVIVTEPLEAEASGSGLPRHLLSAAQDSRRRFLKGDPLPTVECRGIRWASAKEVASALDDPAIEHPVTSPNFGWEGFYARFPRATGVSRISVPGYSQNRRVAVVFYSSAAGLLSGHQAWLEFSRVPRGWKFVARHVVGVS